MPLTAALTSALPSTRLAARSLRIAAVTSSGTVSVPIALAAIVSPKAMVGGASRSATMVKVRVWPSTAQV